MSHDWTKSIDEQEIIGWRRHIHRNPELSFHEVETTKYVVTLLKTFGDKLQISHPTPTSTLVTIVGTGPKAASGKTVMLRADIDALPVQEETAVVFKSTVANVGHVCGHDTHTAMLLETAKVLSQHTDLINGTIKLIFQHAEEKEPGGAQEVVKAGALKGVDAVFGLHIMANQKVGQIGVVPQGATTTTADGFFLTIHGRGGHGSMPQTTVDPIVIGSELVTALQTVVARNVEPGVMAVVSIGAFNSGNAPNVIPDSAWLAGSIRTVDAHTRDLVESHVKALIDAVCKGNGATYDLNYIHSYKAVINDPALSKIAHQSIAEVNGKDFVFDAKMSTASEDFSAYQEVAPVCFMYLGGGTEAEGCGFSNHNPKFNVKEESFAYGVRAEVQIALDFLNQA